MAGFLLAGPFAAGSWIPLAIATTAALFLYAGGLLLNDWADVGVDRLERPDRPLASGRVQRRTALAVAVLLLGAGPALCALVSARCALVALGVAGLIGLYDVVIPRGSIWGTVVMGACRAGSVLLGWSASTCSGLPAPVWLAALLVAAYILGVSLVARDEMDGGPVGARRWVPLAVMVGAAALAWRESPSLAGGLAAVAALTLTARAGRILGRRLSPQQVAAAVGDLIRSLVLLQVLLIAGRGVPGAMAATLLLMLYLAARTLGRHFYGS